MSLLFGKPFPENDILKTYSNIQDFLSKQPKEKHHHGEFMVNQGQKFAMRVQVKFMHQKETTLPEINMNSDTVKSTAYSSYSYKCGCTCTYM